MSLRLTRLDAGIKIVNPDGTPTPFFYRLINKNSQAIETNDAAQESAITAIANAQAAADAADAAAAAANAAAAAADASAVAASLESAIYNSCTNPTLTLTATDAGANATITIAGHTRLYGDSTSLAVSGAAITGLAYSTEYALYYDDASRADTTPPYVATTNLPTAVANYVAGRHFVGNLTTPAALGAPTDGGAWFGAGGGYFEF